MGKTMKTKQITDSALMLKAVANEKRLQILFAVAGKEMNVGEIEKLVNLSQSALSQHLAVLRAAGIVSTRRDAQTIFYKLKDTKVRELLSLLQKLFG